MSVLLVEDHASYSQALTRVLSSEQDLQVVGLASTAAAAAEAAESLRPRVAVVDLDLGDGSGIDVIAEIKERSPATACVVLSGLRDDSAFGRAIEAGAVAVLHKSTDIVELVQALRRVAQGEVILPAEETSRQLRAAAESAEQDWEAYRMRKVLTAREREILQHLAAGEGNVGIARRLSIAPGTVQTHIRNVLAKMQVGSRLEAVVCALRLGLVDPPE